MVYALYVTVGLGLAASNAATPPEKYIGLFEREGDCRAWAQRYAPEPTSLASVNTFKYRCVLSRLVPASPYPRLW